MKRWIKSKQHEDLIEYKQINTIYKKHLHQCKKTHILSRLIDNENKARNLYKILRSLTKPEDANPLPQIEPPSVLPDKFADLFFNKIRKIENSSATKTHRKHTTENA